MSRYCLDCDTELRGNGNPQRCRSCARKVCWHNNPKRHVRKCCVDCGVVVDYRSTRCKSCNCRHAWKRNEQRRIDAGTTMRSVMIDMWSNPVKRDAFMHTMTGCSSKLESQFGFALADAGVEFVPHYRFPGSTRIYDFMLPQASMIIEVDGDYWHSFPEAQKVDDEKDALCLTRGLAIMRVPECEIRKLGCERIVRDYVLHEVRNYDVTV